MKPYFSHLQAGIQIFERSCDATRRGGVHGKQAASVRKGDDSGRVQAPGSKARAERRRYVPMSDRSPA